MKNMTSNVMYIVQDLDTFSYSFKVTLIILFSFIFSPHFSADLSINVALHLQFS